ncbi:Arylsulfatase [Bythopirellula polymerisocia]|uniref:Arylsulfatase n=2 Tax=Bythopirellula polymerisocia TaxID=2528003 RepID=A0A5C6C9H2_9BACT|nr:Arylsulfatase [Bythopirellula polymerisocia]
MYMICTIATRTLGLLLGIVAFSTSWAARPNVLFLAVDDLRPNLGCYGDPHAITPNIDGLASEGLVFTRAYCQQAVCSPSRTSVMTGLRPDSTKVWDLFTYFRDTVPNVMTLPQQFKAHGYHTESIGKIMHKPHMQDDENSWSVPSRRGQGEKYHLPQSLEVRKQLIADAHEKGLTGPAFYYATLGPPVDDGVSQDADHADGNSSTLAVEALARLAKQDKPFFLAVGFIKPHLPFCAPHTYWDLYDPEKLPVAKLHDYPVGSPKIAHTYWGELRHYFGMPEHGPVNTMQAQQLVHGYYACTSFTDAQVGKLLKQLHDLKIDDNTIVVLWGDHGWKLGDYGAWCKHTAFEIDARVPLILYDPRKPIGKQTPALVELVDIYPTLCELSGLPVPEDLEGRSMAPLLDEPKQPWKDFAISQWPGKSRNVMGYSIRTQDWRYTEWVDRSEELDDQIVARELYDHRGGQLEEKVNEIDQGKYVPVVKKLASQLRESVDLSPGKKRSVLQ